MTGVRLQQASEPLSSGADVRDAGTYDASQYAAAQRNAGKVA